MKKDVDEESVTAHRQVDKLDADMLEMSQVAVEKVNKGKGDRRSVTMGVCLVTLIVAMKR